MATRVLAFVAFFCLGTVLEAHSQNDVSTPSYLMRLVHARAYENICVLVRGDGQYHLERELARKTEIFEGSLAPPDLQRIEHFLAAEELFVLTEDQIEKPPEASGIEIILSVHRPGHWQNLTFPGSSSWEPFHESVVPLVLWLEEMRKGKNRVKLREQNATNHCLPAPKLELKTRH